MGINPKTSFYFILFPNMDRYLYKVCVATPLPTHTDTLLAEPLDHIYDLTWSESLTALDFTEAVRAKGDMTFPFLRLFGKAVSSLHTQMQQLVVSDIFCVLKPKNKRQQWEPKRSMTSNKSFC